MYQNKHLAETCFSISKQLLKTCQNHTSESNARKTSIWGAFLASAPKRNSSLMLPRSWQNTKNRFRTHLWSRTSHHEKETWRGSTAGATQQFLPCRICWINSSGLSWKNHIQPPYWTHMKREMAHCPHGTVISTEKSHQVKTRTTSTACFSCNGTQSKNWPKRCAEWWFWRIQVNIGGVLGIQTVLAWVCHVLILMSCF